MKPARSLAQPFRTTAGLAEFRYYPGVIANAKNGRKTRSARPGIKKSKTNKSQKDQDAGSIQETAPPRREHFHTKNPTKDVFTFLVS
jgi:hypothetical protein